MNADGSGKRNLTRNPARDGRPVLVTGRAEDRVRQQPRRASRGSRHERRRERSAESGVYRRDKRRRCASVLSFEHGQDKSRTRRSREALMPRTATGRTARFVAAFTLGRVRHLEAPGSSPRMHARKGPSRARACAGVASRPGQRGQTGCSRSVGPRTTRAEAGRSRLGKTQDRCEDKATYNRHDDRLYDARPVVPCESSEL